jgi:hypothetical protein
MKSSLALVTLAVLGAAVGSCSAKIVAQSPEPATSDTKAPPKVWGVAFGIDAYRGIEALPNCVNDATDMIALLRQNGVPPAQLVLMTDQQCRREAMLDALGDLAKRSKAGDEVMIYFSGHGSYKKDESGDEADGVDETWVTVELDQLLDDELEAAIAKIPGTVYVISDSCHSGTVSKAIEVDRSDSIGKYLSPAVIEKSLGKPESGLTARNIGPRRADEQARQNAQGGSVTSSGSIATQSCLFSSCSDHEVSNASRGERNSAFTAQLLSVLQEADRPLQFGDLQLQVTVRLRNRAFRYPQNPSLFQIQHAQMVPTWLCPGRRPANRVTQVEASLKAQIAAVVDGLQRREDSAPAQRSNWIQSLQTLDGRVEVRDGDSIALRVAITKDAPREVWLCVFNVGPTGNLTLIYPNAYDGNRPLQAGASLTIGQKGSKTELAVYGPAGEEGMVAFALEWNPFQGIDFDQLKDSDHTFVSTDAKAGPGGDAEQGMMRSRDVGPRQSSRPGEGWDRAKLKLRHR